MRAVAFAGLLLVACLPALAQTAPKRKPAVQTGAPALSEARKAGIPDRIGSWQLVRHIPGEAAHFLFASNQRTFSLFVVDSHNNKPLQAQVSWKTVSLSPQVSGYVHKDPRNPERSAIVFKHQSQRRLVMGRLTEDDLVGLAKQLQ